ncbi:HAD family hydrolase, partial [Streptomyces nigra]
MTSTVPAPSTRTADGPALQAVLLDMDGTLVDSEGFWWDVEVEVFASLGHTLDDTWRHVVVGGPMTRSAGFLIEATGADIGLDELTVLLNQGFEDRIDRSLPLMPGAARLLAELSEHGIPTALVSASHRRIIDRVLTTLGPQHFALTVAGDEVSRTKPHPDPYLLAAAGLGADPARCAVVEVRRGLRRAHRIR